MNRTNRTGASSRGQSGEAESGMHNELHQLFLDELADIHSAEQQLIKALPKMAKAAQSNELRQAIEMHLEETRQQLTRAEQVARLLQESIKRKTCQGIKGIIEEAEDMVDDYEDSAALDAAIIAAAQKVEHYEIASYGTLCAWAEQMGHEEALDLLKQSLDEEEAADEKLTAVAESVANQRAQAE